MQVHMRVRRFNPEKDAKAYWGDYTVNDVNPNDSVLDVLHRIKWEPSRKRAISRGRNWTRIKHFRSRDIR